MVADCARHRGIEEVPAVLIDALHIAGLLPTLAPQIAALGQRGTPRTADHDEVANIRWLIAWQREVAVGVAAYRDVFDPHTSATVREVVHIAGSRRAVIELGRYLIEGTRTYGLPLVATVDRDNEAMRAVMACLGMVAERVTYAIGGER